MRARLDPMAIVVEVAADLPVAVASSLRRRLVQGRLVARRLSLARHLSLALGLQLELTLCFPTW